MRSTRQQILAAAERLFSEKGYHNVSMRMIAGALEISVGNLTYYFPRKADLANALLEQELEDILVPVQPGLAVLDAYLEKMLRSLVRHAKLFSDPLMFSTVPALEQEHRGHIACLREKLLALLRVQHQAGLLRAELTEPALEALAELLMYSHVGWQHQVAAQPPEAMEDEVRRMMQIQWTVLRAYLTPAGVRQLEQLYPDKG